MAEELVTIHVFFVSWYGDDSADFEGIEKLIRRKLSENTLLEKKPPPPREPKYKTVLSEDTLEEYLLERLSPEDYEGMRRNPGDLTGLTRDELWTLTVPFQKGRGKRPWY